MARHPRTGTQPGQRLLRARRVEAGDRGDTLFAGSIGRFDFPTSNAADLRVTVQQTLMALPDDMTIHPGHGPSSTIGHERATNPYVVGGF